MQIVDQNFRFEPSPFPDAMDSLPRFTQERRKEEYQMQHFEFYSSQLTHEVKEEVMSVIEEAATAMERSLLDRFPSVDRDQIQAATRKLIEAYSAAVEEWGPSFQEKIDSNFLCIPNHVLLEEDKSQEKQYSREEVGKVDQEIRDLERKVVASKYMKAKLAERLKASKRALKNRSKYIDSTLRMVPSSTPLIKAVDEVDRKRRKCHDMDDSLKNRMSHHEIRKNAIMLKAEIPVKKQLRNTEANIKMCKIIPQI